MIFILIIPFINTFKSFLDLALINKTTKQLIYFYMANINDISFDMFSKRTWIQVTKCQSCGLRDYHKMRHLTYKIDAPPRRCLVVCKNNWKCRLNAFNYWLHELLYRNKALYFKPPITEIINIPRTDPMKKTKGKLFEFWEGVTVFCDRGFVLKVQWKEIMEGEGEVGFEKFITIKKFLEFNPQYSNIKIRDIYFLNSETKEIADTFPETRPTSFFGKLHPFSRF